MKKIIKRNLPLNTVYKINSYNYVPLIDGVGTCCDNCGKLISNMVNISNSEGNIFTVGNDCAETLTNDLFLFTTEINPAFNEGKQFRAKINKSIKKYDISKVYIYTNTDNNKFLVLQEKRGASYMYQIYYFDIVYNYIKDLLTE